MKVEPLKKYNTPEYPRKDLVDSNPDLLKKKLPSSLLNKAAVAGVMTILLAGGLSEKGYVQDITSKEISSPKKISNILEVTSYGHSFVVYAHGRK
jgi:hypothetical protein